MADIAYTTATDLACEACKSPIDGSDVGAQAGGLVWCQDCVGVAEPGGDGDSGNAPAGGDGGDE